MKKILAVITFLFCHSLFAAQAIQFDPVHNDWPVTFNSIPGVQRVYQVATMGKYAFAFDYANNAVSFNDGKEWSLSLQLQNIPIYGTPIVVPKYPDTYQSAESWISVLGNNNGPTNIFYFDGASLSLPLALPFPIDGRSRSFLESHHLLWIADYKTNRIFYTADTTWKMAPQLPAGNLITITTDKLNDDLYALQLDTNKNQYFISHLANNQWMSSYINFFFSSNSIVTDLMVTNGGKTISVFLYTNTDKHIFVSQDNGQHFIDTGSIPYVGQIESFFISLYNGNKGNILWSFFSENAPQNYVDAIAYLDLNAKNPTWIKAKIPTQPLMLINFKSSFYYNTISEDGTQLWINGLDQNNKFHSLYYDIKQGFVDSHLPEDITIDELQATNQGRAFGLGLTKTAVLSLFFDGHAWHTNPVGKLFQGGLSYGYRNDWRVTPKLHTKEQTFVESATQNIWIYRN